MFRPTPLSGRAKASILLAQATSVAGTSATVVAIPWLVLDMGGNMRDAGLVMAAEILPMVLLGPLIASWLTRRAGAAASMASCDAVRAAVMAVVTVQSFHGGGGILGLAALIALAGVLASPHYAAQRAMVGFSCENERDSVQLNARITAATHIGNVLGAAGAAAALALAGPTLVIAANAVCFAVCAILATSLLATTGGGAAVTPAGGGVRTGLHHLIRACPRVRHAALTSTLLDALLVALLVIGVATVSAEAGLSRGVAGVSVAAYGLAAVLAAALAGYARQRLLSQRGYLLVGGAALLPCGWLILPGAGAVGLILTLALAGFFSALAVTACMAVLTARVQACHQGDAFAVLMSLNQAAMAISFVASGAYVEATSGRALMAFLVVAGAALCGSAILGRRKDVLQYAYGNAATQGPR